jgi:nucleolar complex protein 2
MLIDLAKVTETYIPLAPYLFELFNLAEVRNKPKPGSMPSLDWTLIIKAPKEYLHGKVYQVNTTYTWGAIPLEGKTLMFWLKN